MNQLITIHGKNFFGYLLPLKFDQKDRSCEGFEDDGTLHKFRASEHKETEESLDLRSMEMKRTIVFIFLLLVISLHY